MANHPGQRVQRRTEHQLADADVGYPDLRDSAQARRNSALRVAHSAHQKHRRYKPLQWARTMPFTQPVFEAVTHFGWEWAMLIVLSLMPCTVLEVLKLLRKRFFARVS